MLSWNDSRVRERHVGPMVVTDESIRNAPYLAARFGRVDVRIAMGRVLTTKEYERRKAVTSLP